MTMFDAYFRFLNQVGMSEEAEASAVLASNPQLWFAHWAAVAPNGIKNGLIFFPRPGSGTHLADSWFEDTDLEGLDTFEVTLRSAFGKFLLWGRKTAQVVAVDASAGTMAVFPFSRIRREQQIETMFSLITPESFDLADSEGRPLHARARKKLGPLDPEEMYAFVPALCLGGECALGSLERVNFMNHVQLLAQINNRELIGL